VPRLLDIEQAGDMWWSLGERPSLDVADGHSLGTRRRLVLDRRR